MTYHAATLVGLPEHPCEPHITCDSCGIVHSVTTRDGHPYAWFLNRKGPPGWKQWNNQDGLARHKCKRCADAPPSEPEKP